jgi:drug/metabolite transporter (DMT)-like permease
MMALPNPLSQRGGWSNNRLALAQMHLAALLFGCAGIFGRLLDANPAVITAGRTLFGSLTLFAVGWFTSAGWRIRSPRDGLLLLAAGAVLAVHWYSFFAAVQVSSVATGLLAFASFPMFVTLLEPLFFEERIARFDMGAAVVVVAGLLLLAPSLDFASSSTRGVCWGILSGFTFAVFSLVSRSNVRKYPRLMVTAYQQAFALLVVMPFAVSSYSALTLRALGLLAILGVVFTAAAHALFIGSLKSIRAQTASIIAGLEPLYAIVFAALLLGEIPSQRTMWGGLLVLSSALVSTFRAANHAQSPPRLPDGAGRSV